jgi:hypothetical protein
MGRKKKEVKFEATELLCDKCGGKLAIVSPVIKMADMTLLECVDCKERCYKDIEE